MLVLDIETVPLASSLAQPYPDADRNPPGNYKTDEAIAKWRAADRERYAQERAKECSLNPRLGRVLCIGYGGNHERVEMAETEGVSEAALLENFWLYVSLNHDEPVVTWNGVWDLRFLVIRSLAHGIAPRISSETVRQWFAKYRTHPHFDCKGVLTNWEPFKAGEGLSDWATFLGCAPKSDGLTGADVFPLYQAGEFSKITEYCAQDVAATRAVYEKIAPMFGAPGLRIS